MTENRFIRKHTKTWSELETILKQLKKSGYEKAQFHTLRELDRLYRQVSSHLSYAQTYFPDSSAADYLNGLVSEAHNYFYIRKKGNIKSVYDFFINEIPTTIIANRHFFAISLLIFLAASLYGFGMTWVDLTNAYVFLPAQWMQNIDPQIEGPVEWNHPIMSGIIMTNNIYVALKAFAYGISFCVGTIYVLALNGLLLGSLSAFMTAQGNALIYWSLILPHGIIELCAIFISGAAGLKIGYSLIRPGRYKRKDALMIAGKESLTLMGIVIPMLIIAGIIEGFLTPSGLSPWHKLAFAVFTGILLIAYFLLGLKPKKKKLQDL
ncbi:MAG: stage II sporulation protein M [Firmicutes bacterium]|nr:stage II sporulation protein M [Bacillota bacterium]